MPVAPKLRHSAQRPLRPDPVTLRSAPCAQTPSLCAVPPAPKLRHSARSRGIHLRLPRHQPENPEPPALHHGYCDFAQYDGRRHSNGSCGIQRPLRQTSSLCAVPLVPKLRHSAQRPLCPNFVIPRVVAESISACQGINQKIQRPLHSTMDTATSRSMTAVVIPTAVAESSARCAQTPSLCAVPLAPKARHSAQRPLCPNFVIPRVVAESISACQGINQKIQRPLHSTMDTATSRSMTAVVIPTAVAESSVRCAQTPSLCAVPPAPKLRHSARSRGIHLRLPRHQPENPEPPALHHGYCDFAQYDGRRHSRGSCGIQRPLPPNPVIPRSARCAQTSSFRAAPAAPNPVTPRSTRYAQTSSFRA